MLGMKNILATILILVGEVFDDIEEKEPSGDVQSSLF